MTDNAAEPEDSALSESTASEPLPETVVAPSDRHDAPEIAETVIAERPQDDSFAGRAPDTDVNPSDETVDVPDTNATPAPQGWRSRLRRGLARHEGEREGDDPSDLLSSTRFKVQKVIGEGGMGIVCVADDATLGRKVAIKLLRPGSEDSPERLLRFQIEARSAARLRHPNVVTVHEVGEENGRPYLVMDYVEGESLAERVRREGPLDGRTAAQIALSVAEALHYAHTQAILHRDLKPANVLLAMDGTALLTDFGLAKEIESDSKGPTVSGQIMGTPAYMPPEQAQGELERVDRRSDVYSLGATLYEMLVGRAPFHEPRLPQLLRAVVEKDPIAPRAVRPEVERDLETICLTCLEKEPEERYDTAKVLAEELGRYLRHEPVHARRPGLTERGRKWVRRNPVLARGISLSFGAALVVVAISTVLFLQSLKHERDAAQTARVAAEDQRLRAEREAQRAEREAAEALRQAERAEARAEIARGAVRVLVHEVEHELGDMPGTPIREALGRLQRTALEKLEQLQQTQDANAPRSLEEVDAWRAIGELAVSAGETKRANEAFSAAADAAKRFLAGQPGAPSALLRLELSLYGIARVEKEHGNFERALEVLEEASEVYRQLEAIDPEESRYQRAHAGTLCERGDIQAHLGDSQAAVDTYEEALALMRALSSSGTDEQQAKRSMTLALNRLGRERTRLGQLKRGQTALEESLKLSRAQLEERPNSLQATRDLLAVLQALSDVLRNRGAFDRALELALEAQAMSERLVTLDSGNVKFQDDLAIGLEHTGELHRAQGRFKEALIALDRSAQIRREQTKANPTPGNRLNFAAVLNQVAQLHYELGDPDATLEACEEALLHCRLLIEKDPRLVSAHARLARTLSVQGDLHRDRGQLPEALKAYQESREATQVQIDADPENTSHRADLTVNLDRLGLVYLAQGRREEALRTYAQGLEVAQDVVQRDPDNAVYRETLATGYDNVGQAEQALGNLPSALEAYEQAREQMTALVEANPSNYPLSRHLAVVWGRMGTVHDALGQPKQAHECLLQSELRMKTLAEAAPEQSHVVRDYSVSKFTRAQFLKKQGQLERARDLMLEVVANHTRLIEQAPQYQGELETLAGEAHKLVARLELIQGKRPAESSAEHLEVGSARYQAGEFAAAVESYRAAFEDENVRGNIGEACLYNGASAASRAAAEAPEASRATFVAQALEWLREDVRLRRVGLAQLAEQLTDPELHPSKQARIKTIQRQIVDVMHYARDEDTDFAILRPLPEFKAIFAE